MVDGVGGVAVLLLRRRDTMELTCRACLSSAFLFAHRSRLCFVIHACVLKDGYCCCENSLANVNVISLMSSWLSRKMGSSCKDENMGGTYIY